MGKKKRKTRVEDLKRSHSTANDAIRPSVTYRAIAVEPGEKTGVFLEAGGIKMEINPNPSSWEEIRSETVRFHDLLFAKLLLDVDELTRKPWAK